MPKTPKLGTLGLKNRKTPKGAPSVNSEKNFGKKVAQFRKIPKRGLFDTSRFANKIINPLTFVLLTIEDHFHLWVPPSKCKKNSY